MARQRLTGTGGVADLREALRSLVDPLGLVMLTRDRIEEALNDAVSRGRVTADDAQDLATALLERGRRQTNDVLGDLDKMLSAKASTAKRVAGVKSKASKAKASKAAPKASSAPTPGIAGYDDLNAKQVQEKLADLAPAKLRQVREYERANANRKTVVAAIDRRLK
jgi:polyhydroxyalkanoate synthesis regulator phasin